GRGAARGGPDVVHVPVARMPVPDRRDPVAQVERTALEVVLQLPEHVPDHFDDLAADAFAAPAYRAVHEAVRAAGGVAAARAAVQAAPGASTAWVDAVVEQAAEPVRALVTELAVAPLPEDRPESLPGYVRDVVLRLVEIGYTRHIADLRGRLQRMDPGADAAGYQAAFAELVALEGRRRTLRESA
ncbi:DNA primase, partial [Cellulomonas fimi]|nr:DNA primase [Cellulomonas fimi]